MVRLGKRVRDCEEQYLGQAQRWVQERQQEQESFENYYLIFKI